MNQKLDITASSVQLICAIKDLILLIHHPRVFVSPLSLKSSPNVICLTLKSPTTALMKSLLNLKARASLAALAGVLLASNPLLAQTIINASFETDTFTTPPGYSNQGGNGPITGWTTGFPGSVGLNPSAGSPFADNGTVPNGSNVAFLQSAGGTNLTTTVTGLTAGVKYKANFRANARSGNSPLLRFSTDGIADTVETRIWSVGGANPYRRVGFNFTATGASNNITITNNQGGDNTLVIDDFSVTPSSAWSFSPWTDDASSGIDGNYCYTHAYTLGGSCISTVVNGVGFLAAGGGNPSVTDKFSTSGLPNPFGDVPRNLSGASDSVGKSFIYGGPDMSITLTGLKPNTAYVATIFGVNFDGNGGDRTANFTSSLNPSDALTVNLDHYGASNGIRVDYAYTTDPTGTVTINYQQTADASWHTSAFANREAVSHSNWTRSRWNDDATSGVDGTATYTHAYSFGSSDSTTINGIPFTGVAGGNPSIGGSFSTNLGGVFTNDVNTVTGNSAVLAKDFVHGASPAIFQLQGLTPGASYQLTLFSVGWENPDGVRVLTFSGDAGSLVADQDANGNNNGIRFDYRYLADASGNATVYAKPVSGAPFHCYGFCNRLLAAIPTPVTAWQRNAWTNDATSGVDGVPADYTHAYNFGSGDSPAINGIPFTGIAGGSPSAANFSLTSLNGLFTNDGNSLTGGGGGSAVLARDFVYNGNPAVLTLSGLTAGQSYRLTLFSVGWEPGGRYQTFSGSNGALVEDQDALGDNSGIRFTYKYVADAAGQATVLVSPTGGTFHCYGFCNRSIPALTNAPVWTTTAWNGDATSGLTTAGVYTHAYNLASGTNLTINGVGLTGVSGGDPSAANFTTQNFGAPFTGFGNNVGDVAGSKAMATDFVYNGFPGGLNLSGLTPGTEYVLSLYLVGFGGPGGRLLTLSGASGCLAMDENGYGSGNGMRVDYRYTAGSGGTAHIVTSPQGSGSLHLHGFANREATLLVFSPPDITLQPQSDAAGTGHSHTFTVGATGSPTLHYQWKFNGTDLPGTDSPTLTLSNLTHANTGSYTVLVTNDYGSDLSDPAVLTVRDNLAGLFDTGMGQNCVVLGGGTNDPHYTLIVNADGASPIPAIVAAQLPSPPWVLNSATSKWIGPRANSSAAAGFLNGASDGTYVYRLTVDLTGFTPSTVTIRGQYAVDNLGLNILVNEIPTGIINNAGFMNYSTFTLNSGNCAFVAGINTIDFVVQNVDANTGWTGFRVDGIEGFGDIPPGTAPHVAVQPVDTLVPRNAAFCLSVAANGSADLAYQWYLDGNLLPGETSSTLAATANDASVAGSYTVRVSNGAGFVTSDPAVVTIENQIPLVATDGFATSVDTSASISYGTILGNDSDADGDPLAITAIDATSAHGGDVFDLNPEIIYVPPTGFTGTDSFTYTVSDGWGGIVTGTIQVRVLPGTVPACGEMLIYPPSGGTQSFVVGVLPGQSYIIQRSGDLLDWEDLSTLAGPPTGVLDFTDPTPLPERGFYRAKKLEIFTSP